MKPMVWLLVLFWSWVTQAEQPFGPYNQQFTYNQNQQYGTTNWYSSALGMGVAQAGVTLVGGLVNALSRPDPVIYLQSPASPVYLNGKPPLPGTTNASVAQQQGSCSMQTLYDRQGNPRYVKVCD